MKTRTIALILLGVTLLGVTGLCALTAFGTYRWVQADGVHFRFFVNDTVSAETREIRSFPADLPLTLEVDTGLGDIQVSAQEGSTASVEIVRKAWGETQTAAQAEAGQMDIVVTTSPGRLKLSHQGQDQNRVVVLGVSRPGRVSFNIKVPPETSVVLKTGGGDITLVGTHGKADLEANFGQVTVYGLKGGLAVRGNSAGLELKGIDAGDGDITAETSFAGIRAEELSGREINLQTNQGKLVLTGAQGQLDLTNQFGDIQVSEASQAILNLKNESGKISFAGSLDEGKDHSVITTFGDIILSIPATSALTLDLKTEFGKVNCEMPVTLTGQPSETHLQGTVNGGGSTLKVVTSNGTISIKALEENP